MSFEHSPNTSLPLQCLKYYEFELNLQQGAEYTQRRFINSRQCTPHKQDSSKTRAVFTNICQYLSLVASKLSTWDKDQFNLFIATQTHALYIIIVLWGVSWAYWGGNSTDIETATSQDLKKVLCYWIAKCFSCHQGVSPNDRSNKSKHQKFFCPIQVAIRDPTSSFMQELT